MNSKLFTTQNIIKMAMMGALSVILMQFKFSLPMLFPGFLSVDFSDVAIVVGMMTIHPAAGFVIALLKNVLDVVLFGSSSAAIGQLANFVIAVAYITPLYFCLRKTRELKSVTIAIASGVAMMAVVGAFLNYFVMIPMYTQFMPLEAIIAMGNVIYSGITDTFTLVVFSIIPFNLFKGTLVATVSIIVVKSAYPLLNMLRSRGNENENLN
ncbi:MAG: hypothetical protein ATN35_04140 [Epulopiscium sp. Nele67-Bin004]|nr:MAG: hypothetical protein ATN35_04140 [Epulopiscium sp. Nele67-Bin004]